MVLPLRPASLATLMKRNPRSLVWPSEPTTPATIRPAQNHETNSNAHLGRILLQNTPDGSRGIVKVQPTQASFNPRSSIPPTEVGGSLRSNLLKPASTPAPQYPRRKSGDP